MEVGVIFLAACIALVDNGGPLEDDNVEASISVSTSSLETILVYE